MTRVLLADDAWRLIVVDAVRAYPSEACGLLLGDTPQRADDSLHVSRAIACVNIAPPETSTQRFEIDPRVVIEQRRALRGSAQTIVGFYHSHPDAAPALSRTDLEFVRLWPETAWLVVSLRERQVDGATAWWLPLDAHEPRELRLELGKPVTPSKQTERT